MKGYASESERTYVGVLSVEQRRLIEFTNSLSDINHSCQFREGLSVAFMAACTPAVVVRGEVGAYTCYSTKEEHSIEVDVLQSFGVRCNSVDETLEIRALWGLFGKNWGQEAEC